MTMNRLAGRLMWKESLMNWAGKSVLVTGSAGFIGSHLV